MIRFFKRIRQQLAFDNNVSKYTRYAIGEIALVIIGILIAVSINTWNEERKQKNEEQSILQDLKKEMEGNLSALNNVIEGHQKSFEAAKEMRALFSDRKAFDKMTDSTFRSIHAKMDVNHTYDPRYGILNSIISSGQINQLSNKELKYLLASLKEWTVDAFEDNMKIEGQRDDLLFSTYWNGEIFNDGKIIGGLNWKSFYDHPPYRSLVNALYYYTRMYGLKEEIELKEGMEHIVELINQEIEK